MYKPLTQEKNTVIKHQGDRRGMCISKLVFLANF